MSPVAEADVSTKTEVTTKEELAELKRRLSELRAQKSNAPSGNALTGKPYGWQDDIDGLAVFLEDLKQVMKFLVGNRVLKQQQKLFNDCWDDIETRIDLAIAELRTIDSDTHDTYIKLYNARLTGNPLKLKIGEYWRRVKGSPVVAVLEMADRILGSLFPILNALEPVKEFKETLESKLKNDGDEGLQGLNLTGREQWWKQEQKV
jgi:BMFP domain-containing protein YqiC